MPTEIIIPSSENVIGNAAKAIAITAYPEPQQLRPDGKAHKYADALIAYLFRVSQLRGDIERLPPWVATLKFERMVDRLRTGNRCLLRALLTRNLILSVLLSRIQHSSHTSEERSLLSARFSDDLELMELSLFAQETPKGFLLAGRVPEDAASSVRQAMIRHKTALQKFAAPERTKEPDEEDFYRNMLKREVRPALRVAHITQLVWEAANKYRREYLEREIQLDQLLMRKAAWADDLYGRAKHYEPMAAQIILHIEPKTTSPTLVRIGKPTPDF